METKQTDSGLLASIIIASHNRCKDLRECLDALLANPLPDVEIIVVDDASTDDTANVLKSEYQDVTLLLNENNMGPAFARNRGAQEAHGGLLIFLDSDAVPEEGWLENLLKQEDQETLLIGCVQDYEGERIQSGPRRLTFIGKSLPCSVDTANTGASCNMAIPKNVFAELGGFDEEIPYYFEDSYLCVRAKKAGFSAKYVTGAIVRHKGNEFKKGDAIWMQERNSTYAMLKFYNGSPLATIMFILLNTSWAMARVIILALKTRFKDSFRILSGCASAYKRFYCG